MSIVSEKDWRITEKQKNMIHKRIEHFSKKEASLCINMIESIYLSRPSNKGMQSVMNRESGHMIENSKTTN